MCQESNKKVLKKAVKVVGKKPKKILEKKGIGKVLEKYQDNTKTVLRKYRESTVTL